jgi:hypothetical protein
LGHSGRMSDAAEAPRTPVSWAAEIVARGKRLNLPREVVTAAAVVLRASVPPENRRGKPVSVRHRGPRGTHPVPGCRCNKCRMARGEPGRKRVAIKENQGLRGAKGT